MPAFHPRFVWPLVMTLGVTTQPSATHAQLPDIPKLAGSWTWSWKDPGGELHQHVLEVEGVGNALAAREIFDDEPPVKVMDLKYDGSVVRFTVERGARKAAYAGKLAGPDTIRGTVTTTTDGESREFTWTAQRKAPKP